MSRKLKPSIFQTKAGLWRGCLTVGHTDDGKRVRVWRQASTRAEVVAKLSQLEPLPEPARTDPRAAFTMAQWLEHFTAYKRPDARPKTQESHLYYTDKINPALGDKRLNSLTRAHVRTFYADLADRGLSLSTRRHVAHFLKSALNEAFHERLIERNPASVDIPKGPPATRGQAWTAEQVYQFLKISEHHPLGALFHTLLYQGLRPGEALALTWADIDGDQLHVTKTLGRVDGKPVIGPTKNDRGNRVCFLLPQTLDVLEHRQKPLGSSLVFPSTAGTYLYLRNVRRTYYNLLKRAELPRIRLYDHRHTFITLAQHAGVPAYVVAAIAGQDPVITAKTYTHVSDEQKREAVKKLSQYLATSTDS